MNGSERVVHLRAKVCVKFYVPGAPFLPRCRTPVCKSLLGKRCQYSVCLSDLLREGGLDAEALTRTALVPLLLHCAVGGHRHGCAALVHGMREKVT